jgi:hypothetical protein
MKERHFDLPRGREVRGVWNPQEPRTPLEHEWNRLPILVRDYFEIGYVAGNPELTKEERTLMLDRRWEILEIIIKKPNLKKPFLDFLDSRDKERIEEIRRELGKVTHDPQIQRDILVLAGGEWEIPKRLWEQEGL